MKKAIILLTLILSAMLSIPTVAIAQKSKKKIEISHLNEETFKKEIWNYEQNPNEWTFEGKKPCIIDFYASWCAPCRQLAPILQEIANEYQDDIIIYKINISKETKLAQLFGVKQIPAMLFIPKDEAPQMSTGLLPKETIKEAVNIILLKKKKQE